MHCTYIICDGQVFYAVLPVLFFINVMLMYECSHADLLKLSVILILNDLNKSLYNNTNCRILVYATCSKKKFFAQ